MCVLRAPFYVLLRSEIQDGLLFKDPMGSHIIRTWIIVLLVICPIWYQRDMVRIWQSVQGATVTVALHHGWCATSVKPHGTLIVLVWRYAQARNGFVLFVHRRPDTTTPLHLQVFLNCATVTVAGGG